MQIVSFIICISSNTYCFSTATNVVRTRLIGTLSVHCLSCLIHSDAVHLKKFCRLVCSFTFLTLQPQPNIRDISNTLFLSAVLIHFLLPSTHLTSFFLRFFISFRIIIRSAAIFTPETLKADSFYFRKLCENYGGSSFFSVLHESAILKVFSHSSEWKPLCSCNEVF